MMHRLCTALFGLWFSLVVAEPLPLHVCPMHDGPLAHVMAHQAMASPVSAMSTAGSVGDHASHSHDMPAAGTPTEHAAHQCQCLGCCAGTSATALPGATVRNVQATLAMVQEQPAATRGALRARLRVAHALPFANGPPVTPRFLRG